MQFCDSSSSWTTLRWPDGEAWLVNYKKPSYKKNQQEQIINQWMRHYPWTCIKKVFNCDTSGTVSKKAQPNAPQLLPIVEIGDSLTINTCTNRILVKKPYLCTIFQKASQLQLRIISNTDTLTLKHPPVFPDRKTVLLTTFK
ncbi:MAG TPA: hypothetical protein VHO70_12540 [Chitinispirillaceae bacterium]|nr:hypothetical protein [Chitinispirillaceae bacterium]